MDLSAAAEIYSVSDFLSQAKLLLESQFPAVSIVGELSNVTLARSGHWYFSLKDAASQIRCAMFAGHNRAVSFAPENGQQVIVTGRVSLYTARGDFQLIVEAMQLAGVGELQQQFEALKQKLSAEGLFASDRKQPLPAYPEHIGVITSPKGAAIRDICQVLHRRYPLATVTIYPCSVQGAQAASEILSALQIAELHAATDVLILARGGGSMEDLWAFNDETLVRAVAACPIPIVSGVGHEIDFTLCDFSADLRAPTPSAAAELVTPDVRALAEAFASTETELTLAMQRRLEALSVQLRLLAKSLIHPRDRCQQQAQHLDHLSHRLDISVRRIYQQQLNRFTQLAGQLSLLSPLATLSRGYAVVRNAKREIVRDAAQLSAEDRISAEVASGAFYATVDKILPSAVRSA